ncbi:MAG: hypothetical protein DDT36_00513 [Firmicutes bacterium]|nr:hypothetical protein [Bacillota bacterium]
MWWAFLFVGLVLALYHWLQDDKARLPAEEMGIDFANSPERVEMTLRTLADLVERDRIYDFSVYFAALNAEGHAIAMRLGQYIPIHLYAQTPTTVDFIKVDDFPPERTALEMRKRLQFRCRQNGL